MQPPIIYIYSKVTGEFVGSERAVQSPLDAHGVWLMPRNSSLDAPPIVNANQAAVWSGGAWHVEEDHRGTTAYAKDTTVPTTVTRLGPVPDTHTLLAPLGHDSIWADDAWVAPPPTERDYIAAVQRQVDATAASKGYDSGTSCASYVTDQVYGQEAQSFVNWRSSVWAYAYAQMAEVQEGRRVRPTIDGFIEELPVIQWR